MELPVSEAEEKRYAELQLLALESARNGETAILRSMIEAGLPINLEDSKGNTLLMLASYHGHLETTQMLLGHKAEVDRRNRRGQTPLGGVAFKGFAEIAEKLIQAGADMNADNGNGMTPLMFASMFGRTDVVRLLQARGADQKVKNRYGLRASWMNWLSPIFKRIFPKRN